MIFLFPRYLPYFRKIFKSLIRGHRLRWYRSVEDFLFSREKNDPRRRYKGRRTSNPFSPGSGGFASNVSVTPLRFHEVQFATKFQGFPQDLKAFQGPESTCYGIKRALINREYKTLVIFFPEFSWALLCLTKDKAGLRDLDRRGAVVSELKGFSTLFERRPRDGETTRRPVDAKRRKRYPIPLFFFFFTKKMFSLSFF